jgi:hypothetical protein
MYWNFVAIDGIIRNQNYWLSTVDNILMYEYMTEGTIYIYISQQHILKSAVASEICVFLTTNLNLIFVYVNIRA